MSTALLLLAGALLSWPDALVARRARLRALRRARSPRPWRARLARPTAGALSAAGVAGAGALAAALSTLLVGALTAGCAVLLARALARRRTAAATTGRLRALAEALGVLAAEVRSGRSMGAATATAVGACPEPWAAAALERALASTPPVPDARRDDVGRALLRVSAAVELSARTGCSLAAVVGAVEDDLRARLHAAEELRSAVAGPRASAVVLAGLPVLGLVMGAGVGADPWSVLTTTPVGQALLVAGVGLEVAGLAWSSRLVARAVRP